MIDTVTFNVLVVTGIVGLVYLLAKRRSGKK